MVILCLQVSQLTSPPVSEATRGLCVNAKLSISGYFMTFLPPQTISLSEIHSFLFFLASMAEQNFRV